MLQPNLKSLLLPSSIEEPTDELINARTSAIKKFTTTSAPLDKFLELVRFVFSLKNDQGFIDTFRQTFRDTDPEFPVRGRLFELKILAHATILQLFQIKAKNAGILLQLAVNNSFGVGLRDNPKETEIIKIAREALQNTIENKRRLTSPFAGREAVNKKLDEFQATIKQVNFSAHTEENTRDPFSALGTNLKMISKNVNDSLEEIHRNTLINEEELRIMSWSVSGTSIQLDQPWSVLNNNAATLLIAKELSDLVTILPGPSTYASTIRRILDFTKGDASALYTLLAIVSATPQKTRELMIENAGSTISELTPIHFAVQKSLEIESKKKLKDCLEEAKIKTLKQLPALTFALQAYRERLYMKYLSTAGTHE